MLHARLGVQEPVPHITAHPSPSNLLEWHYVLEGAKGTDFATGVYHGRLQFPPQYPFKPPSISLYTPNGRFATNTKLCLSMTDVRLTALPALPAAFFPPPLPPL